MRDGTVRFKPWRFHRIDKASTINSFLDSSHRTIESQSHNSRAAKKSLLRNGTCSFDFQGEHLSVCCNFENRSFFVTGQFATSLRSLQFWKPPFLCYRTICRFSLRARDWVLYQGLAGKQKDIPDWRCGWILVSLCPFLSSISSALCSWCTIGPHTWKTLEIRLPK